MAGNNTLDICTFIKAALDIGYTFADIADRLSKDGYEVPTLEEYEARTEELRHLSDLAGKGEG